MNTSAEHRFSPHQVDTTARLANVRMAFSRWAQSIPAVATRADDLAVVVSELGSNAIAGTPTGSPPAELEAWVLSDRVEIEVRNHVDGTTGTEHWDLDDPLRSGGRGLLLISALTDAVEVDVDDDVLSVRCWVCL